MIELDGSEHSGSGTLVRFSVALAALLGEPLRVVNARARRPRPGLRAQHVAAVRACAELCGATLEGVEVGARAFVFRPGPRVAGGRFVWEIGTAGSATMLALGILPLACLAEAPIDAIIRGGIVQDFAPPPEHLIHGLAPLVARMGARVELRLVRRGYVPGGEGEITLAIEPALRGLAARELLERGGSVQDCAPPPEHLSHVLAPVVARRARASAPRAAARAAAAPSRSAPGSPRREPLARGALWRTRAARRPARRGERARRDPASLVPIRGSAPRRCGI
jgi:RNA 3'-terminal phosphate cyclase (ATP)